MAVHLRALTIRQYEQFRNCERLEFSRGHNLILGVNGSGKTRLCRLLQAILSANYDALPAPFDVAFELGIEHQGQEVILEGEARKQPLPRSMLDHFRSFGVSADHGTLSFTLRALIGGRDRFEYRSDRDKAELRWNDARPVTGAESRVFGSLYPLAGLLAKQDALTEADRAALTEWIATLDLPWSAPLLRESDTDFTELTEAFEYGVEDGGLSTYSDLEVGQDLLFALGRIEPPILGRTWLAFEERLAFETDDDLGFKPCAPLLQALGADRIEFAPRIIRQQTFDDMSMYHARGIEIRVRFASGLKMVDSNLTFGQRRFLSAALAAHCTPPDATILIDEIDNGMHPALVLALLRMLDGRQTFIVSHDKLVVDSVDYRDADDLRHKLAICRRHADGTQTLEQPDRERAEDIFEQIEVGIQEPSDVLLHEGLW